MNYKSTQSDLDLAVQDLNIDGDGTSDEYDFMDDVAGGKDARRPNQQYREPRRKYMDMLQQVADRQLDEVTIELDDLDNVRCQAVLYRRAKLIRPGDSTKRASVKTPLYDWWTQSSETQSTISMCFRKLWIRSCRRRRRR